MSKTVMGFRSEIGRDKEPNKVQRDFLKLLKMCRDWVSDIARLEMAARMYTGSKVENLICLLPSISSLSLPALFPLVPAVVRRDPGKDE